MPLLGQRDLPGPADRVGRRDHDRPGDGRKISVQNPADLSLRVHRRQIPNNPGGSPLEDVAFTVQHARKPVELGVKNRRVRLADRAKRLQAPILDPRLLRAQPGEKLRERFGRFGNPPGNGLAVRGLHGDS